MDYYRDCAETKPYLTKLFVLVPVSGDRFSDAGDSGALVVDTSNAEPVGLFFAGGTDAAEIQARELRIRRATCSANWAHRPAAEPATRLSAAQIMA